MNDMFPDFYWFRIWNVPQELGNSIFFVTPFTIWTLDHIFFNFPRVSLGHLLNRWELFPSSVQSGGYESSVRSLAIRVKRLKQNTSFAALFITLRPRQNGRHFPDDIFKCILLNGNVCISIKISLTFAPTVRINKIPAWVHIMAWRRPGDKPLSKPMSDFVVLGW